MRGAPIGWKCSRSSSIPRAFLKTSTGCGCGSCCRTSTLRPPDFVVSTSPVCTRLCPGAPGLPLSESPRRLVFVSTSNRSRRPARLPARSSAWRGCTPRAGVRPRPADPNTAAPTSSRSRPPARPGSRSSRSRVPTSARSSTSPVSWSISTSNGCSTPRPPSRAPARDTAPPASGATGRAGCLRVPLIDLVKPTCGC